MDQYELKKYYQLNMIKNIVKELYNKESYDTTIQSKLSCQDCL